MTTIDKFVKQRTNGLSEPIVKLRDAQGKFYGDQVKGMRDDFADITGDEYGGREYNGRVGGEIPSTRIEKLTLAPERLADFLNQQKKEKGYVWRESLVEVLRIFFD